MELMEWITPLLVALIGGPVMLILSRLDKSNKSQHDEISKKIDRITIDISDVRKDLHEHVNWHLSEEYDVRKELRRERRERRRKQVEDSKERFSALSKIRDQESDI